MKVAGHFVLRPVAVDSDGHEHFGEESEMEVRFPSYEQIVQNATIVGVTDAAWAATILDCSETNRRERGFWILLNTDLYDNVPGIVYDYLDFPSGSGDIPAGHPLHSPAKRYKSLGVERRPTP